MLLSTSLLFILASFPSLLLGAPAGALSTLGATFPHCTASVFSSLAVEEAASTDIAFDLMRDSLLGSGQYAVALAACALLCAGPMPMSGQSSIQAGVTAYIVPADLTLVGNFTFTDAAECLLLADGSQIEGSVFMRGGNDCLITIQDLSRLVLGVTPDIAANPADVSFGITREIHMGVGDDFVAIESGVTKAVFTHDGADVMVVSSKASSSSMLEAPIAVVGEVEMGEGDDVFYMSGVVVVDELKLGNGDDVFVCDSTGFRRASNHVLYRNYMPHFGRVSGNQGDDSLSTRQCVGNRLSGNEDDDRILMLSGVVGDVYTGDSNRHDAIFVRQSYDNFINPLLQASMPLVLGDILNPGGYLCLHRTNVAGSIRTARAVLCGGTSVNELTARTSCASYAFPQATYFQNDALAVILSNKCDTFTMDAGLNC